ncbi:hypothetical protein [Actinoplanes awajinensis]|uniref:DUF4034 domain-containing protein n=1 Tax=Actinoplanes awajinensis subsp. mycoplanecinus TaxID=135947 RepID=A0A117MRF7_9ACTN|nr:hypothetical protein [Actinoplanes awajinensis]KUL31691.1 hypothetical protein ADL15_21145 [Actinoplanes awajinensis subsp. mycoplanecinus]
MWSIKKNEADDDDGTLEFCRFLDEEAELLRRALRRRDWPTARGILEAEDPELRAYYFSVAATTVGVERWITDVIRDEPDATLPLLLRGAGLLTSAWELRRDGLASTMSDAGAQLWTRLVRQAEECVEEVLRRDPGCADAWTWSIALSRALNLPEPERRRRFQRLVEIEPHHWFGHEQMLLALSPRWGGSSETMFAFARERSAACPGTHIPTLIVLAHQEQFVHLNQLAEPDDPDREPPLSDWEPAEVMDEVWEAAEASYWHDDYPISVLTPIVWNTFAYAFTWGDFHKPAWSLFDSIGEDWITREPWETIKFFRRSRTYTEKNL